MLLLQVAHPVVGAGVADHSEFLADRWARIRSTAASARRFSGLDGPDAAIEEGRRLRRLHREIQGVDALGRRYHASDSHAYLWVAATGFWASAVVRQVHGPEFDDATEAALYTEWTDQARVLRIPDRVIPADRAAFRAYFDHTVGSVLERNSTTDLLIELDRHPMPPPPELGFPSRCGILRPSRWPRCCGSPPRGICRRYCARGWVSNGRPNVPAGSTG